jgi:sulfur carrier protein ThiS
MEAVLNGKKVSISENEVKKYIDQLLGERSQPAFIKKKGKVFTVNGQIIHINTY